MLILSSFILTSLIFYCFYLLSKKNIFNYESLSSFECGFNPLTPNRTPFSLQFFKIAILFLMFDIEILLIAPMPLYINMNFYFTYSSTFILLVIFLGFLFEWNQGILNWIK